MQSWPSKAATSWQRADSRRRTRTSRWGDVPNVAFPYAALHDHGTGRLAIYYGGADTVTSLAFAYVDELMEFTRNNSVPIPT